MSANVAATADLVGALEGSKWRDRTAACAMAGLDSRSFAKDPYYILPMAMAILMYLSTKMTPQTTVDPSQQRMMSLMPLMMAAFFFNLSSGLNLYMFTSNLIASASSTI